MRPCFLGRRNRKAGRATERTQSHVLWVVGWWRQDEAGRSGRTVQVRFDPKANRAGRGGGAGGGRAVAGAKTASGAPVKLTAGSAAQRAADAREAAADRVAMQQVRDDATVCVLGVHFRSHGLV